MRKYIQPIIDQITSTRSYIIYTLSAKTGRTPWIVEYIIVFWILYLVALFFLHKIYRFFVRSVQKQKANFLFVCDTILYEFQYKNISNSQDLSRIQDIIKKGSYEQSYDIFLEKIPLLWSEDLIKKIKKTHTWYINSSRRKMLCWVFLTLITLWIYKLFLEN